MGGAVASADRSDNKGPDKGCVWGGWVGCTCTDATQMHELPAGLLLPLHHRHSAPFILYALCPLCAGHGCLLPFLLVRRCTRCYEHTLRTSYNPPPPYALQGVVALGGAWRARFLHMPCVRAADGHCCGLNAMHAVRPTVQIPPPRGGGTSTVPRPVQILGLGFRARASGLRTLRMEDNVRGGVGLLLKVGLGARTRSLR